MSVMTHRTEPAGPPPSAPRRRAPRRSYRPPRAVTATGLVVLVVFLIVVAVSWTHAPWRDYVRRKPPNYVELTVVRPQALASTFVSGHPVRFDFSINNVDQAGTHRTITWVTSVRDTVTGHTVVADRGSEAIAAGSVKTLSQQVTIRGTHRSEVIVKLGSGQQIDFYVSPKPAAGSG
jgi:hypothetical protein